ncbi:MAG: ice-binding family protein [Verrucomicrobiota bacterium]
MRTTIAKKTITNTGNASNRARLLAGIALAILLTHRAVIGGEATVALGSAATFAVLAGATVTSTGNSIVNGDVGAGPGTAVPGFPPGVINGMLHTGDPAAAQAQADLTIAYNDAAGRTLNPVTVAGNIGGQTLPPGLYKSTSSLAISSGDLTLDAGGDANAVFIFQIASTLTTTSGRQVILSGGAIPANIFWQVGSSATLGTTTVFKGNILADQSITLETGATLDGRALARVGSVTLDANTITTPSSTPVTTPLPPSFGPVSRAPDGSVTLVITNTPGLALTLQYSTDFTSWTVHSTPTPTSSPYAITDTTALANATRFYRAFYP